MTTIEIRAHAAGTAAIDGTVLDAPPDQLHYMRGVDIGPSSGDTGLRQSIIRPIASLEQRFRTLTDQWLRATGAYSFASQKAMHPAYLQIIAMGKPVIPLILKELSQNGGHWYIALESLNDGASPVSREDSGNIRRMKQTWLDWGRSVCYV